MVIIAVGLAALAAFGGAADNSEELGLLAWDLGGSSMRIKLVLGGFPGFLRADLGVVGGSAQAVLAALPLDLAVVRVDMRGCRYRRNRPKRRRKS